MAESTETDDDHLSCEFRGQVFEGFWTLQSDSEGRCFDHVDIAEGFERGGRGEFHQFLSTSKASCAEVRSLLYVALDNGYIGQSLFDGIIASAEEVGRIVGGLRASVEKQKRAEKKDK